MDHAQHTQKAKKHEQHAEIINRDGLIIGIFTLISIALLALTIVLTSNGDFTLPAPFSDAPAAITSMLAP